VSEGGGRVKPGDGGPREDQGDAGRLYFQMCVLHKFWEETLCFSVKGEAGGSYEKKGEAIVNWPRRKWRTKTGRKQEVVDTVHLGSSFGGQGQGFFREGYVKADTANGGGGKRV